MNLDYSNIFHERGGSYGAAMRRWPHARNAEFEALFAVRKPAAGETLLDVPAGGGYLRSRLPGVHVTELEFSDGFGDGVPVVDATSAWPVGEFDHVCCVAALHHIAAPREFVARLVRHVRSGGILHLADVAKSGRISRFLDGFVGSHIDMGHEGAYFDPHPPQWAALGDVVRSEVVECDWWFASRAEAASFCRGLFSILSCPESELEEALAREVGFVEKNGRVGLRWELLYTDIVRR